jgi:hypothetical protein
MNTSPPAEQNGLFTGRTIFDRCSLTELFVLPTAMMLQFTGPAMLVGWAISQIDEAIAPGLSDVPAPSDWPRRELETVDGSGSGGKFDIFVVMSPDDGLDRAEAEARYRNFVLAGGWDRRFEYGRDSYERGDEGSETILVLASDLGFDVSTYGAPPTDDEFVVMATYADWGDAERARQSQQFILLALAATVLPGLSLAAIKLWRDRRSETATAP